MCNHWLVLFDAEGNPKGDYFQHEIWDEPKSSSSMDKLIVLSPLKAENVGRKGTLDLPEGEFMYATHFKFAVGDSFRRVDDDEFRKLFGEEAYQKELAEKELIEAERAEVAEQQEMGTWGPPKTLEPQDFPAVEPPEGASEELSAEVRRLAQDGMSSMLEALGLIEDLHPGFVDGWLARVAPEYLQRLHEFTEWELQLRGFNLIDQCDIAKVQSHGSDFKAAAASELAKLKRLLEVVKHFQTTGPLSYDHLAEMYGVLEHECAATRPQSDLN